MLHNGPGGPSRSALPFRDVNPVVDNARPGDGGTRRKVESELLIQNDISGSYTDSVASFKVTNPSTRLLLNIGVTYLPNNSEDTNDFPTSGPSAWLVALTAWIRLSTERNSVPTRGNLIVGNSPVPFTYDVPPSCVAEIRGIVTVPAPLGTLVTPGQLYVTATWEQNPGAAAITDKDLAALFTLCRVNARGIHTFESGGE